MFLQLSRLCLRLGAQCWTTWLPTKRKRRIFHATHQHRTNTHDTAVWKQTRRPLGANLIASILRFETLKIWKLLKTIKDFWLQSLVQPSLTFSQDLHHRHQLVRWHPSCGACPQRLRWARGRAVGSLRRAARNGCRGLRPFRRHGGTGGGRRQSRSERRLLSVWILELFDIKPSTGTLSTRGKVAMIFNSKWSNFSCSDTSLQSPGYMFVPKKINCRFQRSSYLSRFCFIIVVGEKTAKAPNNSSKGRLVQLVFSLAQLIHHFTPPLLCTLPATFVSCLRKQHKGCHWIIIEDIIYSMYLIYTIIYDYSWLLE